MGGTAIEEIAEGLESGGKATAFERCAVTMYVGEGYPDLLVHLGRQKVVVELKAVSSELGECEEKQLRNYMKILGLDSGLLINFQMPGRKQGKTRLEICEIVA